MKRQGNLYSRLISDENLRIALEDVNRTHRWLPHHRPHKIVARVEADMDGYIKKLRAIIEEGFEPRPAEMKRRWDKSAGKWRDIYEPKLWPDQYVQHAMVQVLQPVMMRGMDDWCCGSIQGRGIHYGMRGLKKWMKNDVKGTRWCAELDIHHYYESLKPEVVMNRMRQLVKDRRMLDLVERVLRPGVMIGAYCSQWFANVVLQPIDHALRESGIKVSHYMRYIDNFTLFSPNKRELKRAVELIRGMLEELGLKLKGNYQRFRTADRMPCALGYRYGHGYTLLRKRNLFRLKRQLNRYYAKLKAGVKIPRAMAAGLLSRLGQMKHCCSTRIREKLVRHGTIKQLKNIIRTYARKEKSKWNISLEARSATAGLSAV